MNENEDTKYQNSWNAAKECLERNLHVQRPTLQKNEDLK